ncbi:MAG: TonB-dependent receptor [Acidobacteriota bacterium]
MLLKRSLYWLTLFCFCVIFSSETSAQLGASGLNGTIKDLTEAVVGGALITTKNKTTSQIRTTVTNETGFFSLQSLQPGTYEIIVEAPGFETITIEEVILRVGEVTTIAGKLKPAIGNETVEVNAGQAFIVNTTTSDVSGVISDRAIANLPLNGRNFLDLALLLPGNTSAQIFDPSKTFLNQSVSNGQSARAGNNSIDGVDNNEDLVGGILQNIPIDGVQEFQIANASYSAEFGRSASSIVNIVTKTGANEFHGSGIIFFRNDNLSGLPPTLDRDRLRTTGLGNPKFDREHYSVSASGPIVTDRAWFFTALEYRNQDGVSIVGERDLASRRISNVFAATPLNDLLLNARGDFQTTNRDRMSLRYLLQREDDISLVETALSTAENRIRVFNRSQALSYNWVRLLSNKTLNDFVIASTRYTQDTPIFSKQNRAQLSFPSIVGGSNNLLAPVFVRQQKFQIRNNLSTIFNRNTIKLGFEFQKINSDLFEETNTGGTISLQEDFAEIDRNNDGKIDDLDIPIDSVFRRILGPNSSGNQPDLDNKYLAFYIQNDWRVNDRLTFNLGLRYEIDTDINNRSKFFQLSNFGKQVTGGRKPRIDKNNFAPRIGFNWNLFGNNMTSIHGGYGIYYSRVVMASTSAARGAISDDIFEIRAGSELDEQGKFVPGTSTFTNPFNGPVIFRAVGSLAFFDPNFSNPYVQQFSLGIQQQLTKDLVVSIDGLHTLGLKFPGSQIFSLNGMDVFLLTSRLKNWYDALLVKLEKRPSNRFSFLASYTFAKSLAESVDFVFSVPDEFTQSDTGSLKSHSATDLRHRFSFSGIVDLPLGIQLSSILTLESDLPIDIRAQGMFGVERFPIAQRFAGGRQFRTGAQLNAFIRMINNDGGFQGRPLPLVRDDLRFGDSLSSLDLRVSKTFQLGEKLRIQIISEVFNLFNITNIRGIELGTSGFQNVLARDSNNPANSGFLFSSTFGRKLSNAGGVFGTGGPRAFQFALRVSF